MIKKENYLRSEVTFTISEHLYTSVGKLLTMDDVVDALRHRDEEKELEKRVKQKRLRWAEINGFWNGQRKERWGELKVSRLERRRLVPQSAMRRCAGTILASSIY